MKKHYVTNEVLHLPKLTMSEYLKACEESEKRNVMLKDTVDEDPQ